MSFADPPPVAAHAHPEFIEVASLPGDPGFADLLRRMGFRHAGRHQHKPVTWWANGAVSFLFNEESDIVTRRPEAVDRPSVTSIGMAVDDVSAFAARAEALQWRQVPRHRSDSETALPGAFTPSGIEVFATGQPGTAQDWRRDFVASDAAAGDDSDGNSDGDSDSGAPTGPGWTGVDHIGTVVLPDDSDTEISFYRQLFGMYAGPVSEFHDPNGRLRSRDLRAADNDSRVVHNIVVQRPGRRSRATHGINQLAFGTDDLVADVVAMRAAGAPLLAVPDNYYEDLDARLDLDPQLLTALRDNGILYDRDEHGGELLHVYTPMIGGRFYLELLERRGGYDGYGIPSTPVRLAAQAATPSI